MSEKTDEMCYKIIDKAFHGALNMLGTHSSNAKMKKELLKINATYKCIYAKDTIISCMEYMFVNRSPIL